MSNNLVRNVLAASAFVVFGGAAIAQAPNNDGRADKSGGGAAEMSATTGSTASSSSCNADGIKVAEGAAMKMTNASMKTDTMKEIDMAKAMMAKNDMAGCKMHLDKATSMLK
jgi:hypothetical protein